MNIQQLATTIVDGLTNSPHTAALFSALKEAFSDNRMVKGALADIQDDPQKLDDDARTMLLNRLVKKLEDDSALVKRLTAILESKDTGGTNLTVGSGAAAIGNNNTVVGERGVNIGGQVSGGIFTGDGNVYHINTPHDEKYPDLSIEKDPYNLREKMLNHLNRQELQNVVFDLGLNYERLDGHTLDGKVVALIKYCQQRGQIEKLVDACEKANSYVNWR